MLLLDTNVLAYAHDSASKNYVKAKELLGTALRGEIKACVSYQNLVELYAVLTNPTKLARPFRPSEAAELCALYIKSKNLLKLIPTEQTYLESLGLAGRGGATSAKIFDCLLAATLRANDIKLIYTENTKDFEPFKFITEVNPFLEKRKD